MSSLALALISGIVFGSLLALTAVGLTFVFGVLRIPNFAQGEFAAFAGFATVILLDTGLSLFISALIALVLTFISGVLVERLIFTHFYDREHFFLQSFFVSFGLVMFFSELLRFSYGAGNIFRIDAPSVSTWNIFGVTLNGMWVIVAGFALVLLVLLNWLTRHTYIGLAIRSIADDKDLSRLTGVNQDMMYMLTFGLGALLTGFTGILYGIIFSISPGMGIELTAFAFVIVVIGGIGSYYGAIIASILIGIVDSGTATFLGSRYRLIVIFLILFLVLVVKPEGIREGNL